MKKISFNLILIAIGTIFSSEFSSAQSGIIKSYSGSSTGDKMLTMEETILSRNILPKNIVYYWNNNSSYVSIEKDRKMLTDVLTGVSSQWKENGKKALPEGSANAIQSCNGDVAYTIGKSLYYVDYQGHNRTIKESENDQITYGQSVSRQEFGINEGIYWSPDGSKLAFYRKDESKVTDFPLLNIKTRTGTLFTIKYPMNGMASENVKLGIYNLYDSSIHYADVHDFGYDQYLTNISWSPDNKYVFIQVLDRSQKHLHLNMYKASDGSFVKTILTEDNEKFVEPLDHLIFLKDSYHFIYRTDNRDAYKNLYLCDTLGNVRRLTCVNADVSYEGNDGHNVFYSTAEFSPVQNHLMKISVKEAKSGHLDAVKFGKPVRLTTEDGWHSVSLSPDCKWFIDSYSSLNVPKVINLRSVDGKHSRNLVTADDPLKDYAGCEVDLGTVKSADGKYDNYYRLIKPNGFNPNKKYPLILYVYGGPHSQMVTDSWLGQIRMWEYYMAQRGYVVYVQDNRGTQNQGAEYEKSIHDYCGQAEMADQMVGINMLRKQSFIDTTKIGVHGWSYGGFMTISLITNYPDVFKVAVAGGPVIDWKWYEIMYGERYMDTEATNPDGFAKVSLINKAKDLKGKLLICQGAVDNTVVWEHSLSFIQECIKDNIPVDYFPYPVAQHNVFGHDRVHLMNKVTAYFQDNL